MHLALLLAYARKDSGTFLHVPQRAVAGFRAHTASATSSARAWLAGAQPGLCAPVKGDDLGGNCDTDIKGSWSASMAGPCERSSLELATWSCLQRCQRCRQCNFITVTTTPWPVDDTFANCKWFSQVLVHPSHPPHLPVGFKGTRAPIPAECVCFSGPV